jgi:hypothetical protein
VQGLTVQGVSPYRLTPVTNPDIPLTPEFRAQLARKNLVRLFIEPRTAIALVGHGLRRAARTVGAHVQATLTTVALARAVASMRSPELLTMTAAHPSDYGNVAKDPQDKHAETFGSTHEPEEVIVDLSDTNEDMDIEF